MTPEGTYPAKIVAAWLEQDDNAGLLMCFTAEVALHDGRTVEVAPRHMTEGKHGWSGKAVAELFELEWPGGLRQIDSVVGKECEVSVKHKEGRQGGTFENAYIVTGRKREPATTDQIEAALAKLEAQDGDDDDAPF